MESTEEVTKPSPPARLFSTGTYVVSEHSQDNLDIDDNKSLDLSLPNNSIINGEYGDMEIASECSNSPVGQGHLYEPPNKGSYTSSLSMQLHTADLNERLSFTSSELKTPSPDIYCEDEISHNPEIRSDTFTVDSPGDSPRSRNLAAPTPINLNFQDLVQPLEDYSQVQKNITERKYPILPSINKSFEGGPEVLRRESTCNQLDYTREKMENEADFFSEYRVNTSLVKATPRQNPLPPIRQSSFVGGFAPAAKR